jgi:membrane associated rhomboid family serine protease
VSDPEAADRPSTATTCFHHPDRETGRRCTRCGRPACPDCLIQASVGSQCFECVRAAAPAPTDRARRWVRSTSANPWMTQLLVVATLVAYALISLRDGRWDGNGQTSLDLAVFGPAVHDGDYYRLLSNAIVHYGPIHIAFNMFVLYQVGIFLEPATGHARLLLLYVVSVLGGAAGALLLDPHVYTGGASGGVFGLAAAATLALSRQGVKFSQTTWGPLIVINFFFGFFLSNVSIGGHLGGIVAGLLATEAMLQARRLRQAWLGYAGATAVGALSIVVALAAAGR